MLKGFASYLIIMVCMCNHISGQRASLFQAMTTKDGLPSNYVFDLSEDENGYLWIGTDKGLARYDGFQWRVYTTEQGLPGNYINMVKCTGKDGIWLGISTKGIYHYKISSGKLTFVVKENLQHYFFLNNKRDLFFYGNQPTPDTTSGWIVSAENPGKPETAFTLSGNDFVVSTDFENKKLILYPTHSNGKNTYKKLTIRGDWKADTADWVVNGVDFLEKINDSVLSSTQSLYYRKHGALLKIPVYSEPGTYLSAYRYKNGFWVWNVKQGLAYTDDNGNTKYYTEKEGLNNLLINGALQARNGNMLFGTMGGGINYKLPEGTARLGTNDKPVRGLAQKGGLVLATVDNHLLTFDILHPENGSSYILPDKGVQGINILDNDIYISSIYGFSVYAFRGNTLVKKDEQKIGAGISSVIKVRDRYYAGSYGSNIYEYFPDKHIIKNDITTPWVSEKLQNISSGYTTFNHEDGLHLRYSGKKINITRKEGLPSDEVFHVHEYKDTLWISTSRGIAACTQGKIVKTYTAENGIKGGKCKYSFHDNKGQFWLLTQKYLHSFTGSRFTALSTASLIEGKNDELMEFTYDSTSNVLVTGSLRNILITKLDNIISKSQLTGPALDVIFYNGHTLPVSRAFELPAQNNNLSFSFKPINTNPFVNTELYYKLTGLDTNFIVLKDSLTVNFYKLRSGNYQLIAKTVDEYGIESEEKILASFTVQSPFWQKGWFYILSALLAGAAFVGLYGYIQKRKIKRLENQKKLDDALHTERERISKDLHDHLGTSLVTMLAQADGVETKLQQHKNDEALQKIQQLGDETRAAVNILRETVWAVQESSHSLQDFILRLKNFLQRLYAPTNISWEINNPGEIILLSPNQTLQLFRMLQEISQNICKHSSASQASYHFAILRQQLVICVRDNGKGFDSTGKFVTNGLQNLQNRISDIHGELHIESAEGKGTSITVTIQL